MLILSRKVNQGIVIKDVILIKVLSIRRDRVKLGISAPEDVGIVRREISQLATNQDSQVKPHLKASLRSPSATKPSRRIS